MGKGRSGAQGTKFRMALGMFNFGIDRFNFFGRL